MATTQTDSELGRHLLTTRSFHFIFGSQGDPYSLLLRAESDDRHELGRRVRAEGALYKSSSNAWVTADYELGRTLLADTRLAARHGDLTGPQQHNNANVWDSPQLCHVLPLDESGLYPDATELTRLRAVAEKTLTEEAIARQQAHLEQAFAGTLKNVADGFDLVVDFARPASVTATADLLGLPQDVRARYGELADAAASALDASVCPPMLTTARQVLAAITDIRSLLTEVLGSATAGPGDGLLSDLVASGSGEQAAKDAVTIGTLFTVAGIEVTTNLIANTVEALLGQPQQWAALLADPALAGAAVEETLRFDPPVRIESRVAQEPLEIGEQSVAAGEQVVVLIEAANRDPRTFNDPDTFDLHRGDAAKSLSFTGDQPVGLVAGWVRAQTVIAVRALAEHKPDLSAPSPALRRMRSPVVRGVLRYQVSA